MMVGAKLNEKTHCRVHLFDNATMLDTPHYLRMSLARAYIASVEHTAEQISIILKNGRRRYILIPLNIKWDDMKRPEVPIHTWICPIGVLRMVFIEGESCRKKQVIN